MSDAVLQVSDFSAGITDYPVGANPSMMADCANFIVGRDGKALSRGALTLIDSVKNQIPYVTTPVRVDSVHKFKNIDFVFQAENKLYDINLSEVVGPTGNHLFPSTAASFSQNSYAEWNNHLIVANDSGQYPQMIYKDGSTLKAIALGLPTPALPTVTGPTGTATYIYALCYSYSYTINGISFLTKSAVTVDVTYTGAVIDSTNPAVITIPAWPGDSGENFDKANITCEIYRSQNAQSVLYKVGSVALGTTSFTDSTTDTDIYADVPIYTTGGDLNYDRPPKCKFTVGYANAIYYVGLVSAPNTLVQANPLQPHAAPGSNTAEFEDDITAVGVAGQYVVVFTKSKTYQLSGQYDSLGSNGIFTTVISKSIGCVSNKSLVQTTDGLYFASGDGFYFTDGLQVSRISNNIPVTYQPLVQTAAQAKRIYGAYDPLEKRIYWACTSLSSVADNDTIFYCNTYAGVGTNMPFFYLNGGNWASNFSPTAIWFDTKLFQGDRNGYLLYQDPTYLNDVKINVLKPTSSWTSLPIIPVYTSPHFDLGDTTRRKWVTKVVVYCDGIAKLSLGISSNNDNIGEYLDLKEIKSNQPILWQDPEIPWADDAIRWDFSPIISAKRFFPKNTIRYTYKQVKFTKSYTTIMTSDDAGLANYSARFKQVSLVDTTSEWPNDPVDYYISFADDDYATSWLISDYSGGVLTIEDATASLSDKTGVAWSINGYRKDEAMKLLSYSIIYTPLTPSQTAYKAGTQ